MQDVQDELDEIDVQGNVEVHAFDLAFEHIFILKDLKVFEKRNLDEPNKVVMSIELEREVESGWSKQLSLSSDGTYCAIRGGHANPYFYLIDLKSEEQHKLTSSSMSSTFAPCFINGATEFVVVGDTKAEIWNVTSQKQSEC